MSKAVLGDIFKGLNKDINWIQDRTIFLTVAGSRSYNLHTEESDFDYRGLCIPPKQYFLGFNKRFDQLEIKNPDATIFNIKKFFSLAYVCNPNILDVLFTEPEHHILVSDAGKILLENREAFLSKQLKERYVSYAKAQAHRIKNHRRWLLNPMTEPPTRESLGLPELPLIEKNQFDVVKALIRKKLESWIPDFEPFSESQKIYLNGKVADILSEIKITSDDKWLAAARTIGLNDNLIDIIKKEKEYENKIDDWKSYTSWKKNRNPKRAAMEERYGYDCYVEETEFLTENGWKKFDNISSDDKLATVYIGNSKCRGFLEIEYENYIERFDGTFTGNLYNLIGYHTNVLVTPNHNLLIQEEHRKSGKKENWSLTQAAHLPHTFNVVRQLTPITKNYTDKNIFDFSMLPIKDIDFMKLIGWYLSDGSMAFYVGAKETVADNIRISQIKNGKLYFAMYKFYRKYNKVISCHIYEYEKKPNGFNPRVHIETILSVSGVIPKLIYKECGNVENKRIPRWAYKLSKRKMEKLLDALIDGDGTKGRPDNGMIYYSSSKILADDVQELAFMCGFETSLYGPYNSEKITLDGKIYKVDMYQVHINKTRDQSRILGRHSIRKIPVENKRIVCFTVPNHTLITRFDGHIGIHGNSKHSMHLVRLFRMGKEILETGKVNVKRTYDREELMAIRNGAWSYEKLIDYADKIEEEVKVAYKNSKLPNQPNINYLDELCIKLVEKINDKNCSNL